MFKYIKMFLIIYKTKITSTSQRILNKDSDPPSMYVSFSTNRVIPPLLNTHSWPPVSSASTALGSQFPAQSQLSQYYRDTVQDAECIQNVTSPRTGNNSCKRELQTIPTHDKCNIFFYRIISSIQRIISETGMIYL